MKSIIVICLSALVVAAYADKLDDLINVDFEKLFSDEARRKTIIGCMLDELPCGEYQSYRDVMPDIIATNCGKCTPKQKNKYEEANKYLLEKYPTELNAVINKYRPKAE